MNTQSIRRSVFAVLLAAPPLVLAQAATDDKAAVPTPPARPDLQSGKLEYKLTPEELQTFMATATRAATEIRSDEPLSDVTVRGRGETLPQRKLPIAVKPCGLLSVMWFIEHPAEGWRIFTPIAADGELNVCLKPPLTSALPAYVPTKAE